MVQDLSFNNFPSNELKLPDPQVPSPAQPLPSGSPTPGGNSPLTSLLSRAPAPPAASEASPVNRRATLAPDPKPTPTPDPKPSLPEHTLNTDSQDQLRKKQEETDRLEDERTKSQIQANTAATERMMALKASERMGEGMKQSTEILSKLVS